MSDGMLYDGDKVVPGKILALWVELRKRVGIVELKKKNGMKFETRASTDLMDKLATGFTGEDIANGTLTIQDFAPGVRLPSDIQFEE